MSASAIPTCRNLSPRKRTASWAPSEISRQQSLCVALLTGAFWLWLAPPIASFPSFDVQPTPLEQTLPAAQNSTAALSAADLSHARRESRIKEYIASRFDLATEEVELIVETVYKSAKQFDISPNLIFAIIAVESSFDPDATNAGAIGLMQLMPSYHRKVIHEFGKNGFDPVVNIYAGTKVLKQYIAISKTTRGALLRYNGSLADPQFTYARKVFTEMQHFDKV